MRSIRLGFLSVVVVTGALMLWFLLLSGTALAESWMPKNTGGFGDFNNKDVLDMVVYNSNLYAGTYSYTGGGGQGCEVWRYDGVTWTQVVGQDPPGTLGTSPGFGDINNYSAQTIAVLGSYLYVGTDNDNGCEVWRYDGSSWTRLVGPSAPIGPGFGNALNTGVHSLTSDGTYLYTGTNNDTSSGGSGCEVWRYDGTVWTMLVGPGAPIGAGFGNINNGCAHSMAFLGSSIYVGTYNGNQGCEVWRYDGMVWTKLVGAGASIGNGFNNFYNITAWSMAMFDGAIYVGTERGEILDGAESASDQGTEGAHGAFGSVEHGQPFRAAAAPPGSGCQVWRFDGSNWIQVVGQDPTGTPGTGPGFGDDGNYVVNFLTEYNGFLYAGTGYKDFSKGCQVWRFDRSSWTKASQDGFGNPYNAWAVSMTHFYDTLFVGTGNPLGSEVWATPFAFYFAEGYTGPNFQEYLCLGNPFNAVAHVNITYLFPDGSTQPQFVDILPNYRTTIPVNSIVGQDREVSCKLESDIPIVAERPMYFNYNGTWDGGHDTVGATTTSTAWYFAEGYTGPGFDEWICVLNPQGQPANLTFSFQTQEAGLKEVSGLSVAAHSRGSFKVNSILGPDYQTSLELKSDVPVVAERPMYFDYLGREERHWTGGHCVMGTPTLAKEYSFAEGTTRLNFDEWITLQNPNAEAITVNAVYQMGPGQGDPVTKAYTVESGRRFTIYVPEEVGTERDVSTTLSSSSLFLAERPLYFRYTALGVDWTGGHCVIGAFSPAKDWFFAEGYTGTGFQEWLCLQNAGDTKTGAEIYYYTQEQGPLELRKVEVPPRTRVTIMVNENAGPDFQLSTRVKVISGPAIVAERPMYFLYNGVWSGGHDVVGYAP